MGSWVQANAYKAKIFEGGRPFLNGLDLRLYATSLALSGTVQPAYPADEVVDGGYAPVANPFPNVMTVVTAQGKAVGVSPTWIFTYSAGSFTVYGVYLTDPANGDATVMACAATVPFTVTGAGQAFTAFLQFLYDDL